MAEYNFQLRGWHVLVGIAAVLGFFGIQTYLRIRTVDNGIRDAVRERLVNEYSGRETEGYRADCWQRLARARRSNPCLTWFSATWSLRRSRRSAG